VNLLFVLPLALLPVNPPAFRACDDALVSLFDAALEDIVAGSGGDARAALNTLEAAAVMASAASGRIDIGVAEEVPPRLEEPIEQVHSLSPPPIYAYFGNSCKRNKWRQKRHQKWRSGEEWMRLPGLTQDLRGSWSVVVDVSRHLA
jgi:hypothetical protein